MEIRSINLFLDYYIKIWNRTIRVSETIPEDKIHWKPNETSFSFADILTHITNLERFMFAETMINKKNRYLGDGNKKSDLFKELMKKWQNMFHETYDMISTITNDQLEEQCITPDGASIRTWKWLRAMIEHHIHHRGQIYTYLNLINSKSPPLYGLTSEQVKERSN